MSMHKVKFSLVFDKDDVSFFLLFKKKNRRMEQNLCKDNFHHNSSQLIKQKIIGMILQNWKNVALKITSNLLLAFLQFW